MALDAVKSPAGNKKDVLGIDFQWIFDQDVCDPFGWNIHNSAFQKFQKRLLHPSPLTSRVMEGLSLLRAILSISSIKTMPFFGFFYIIICRLEQSG